jgi:hypothetical protein
MPASSRSGPAGGHSGGGGPTDVQSARTLYGHDLHLERGAAEAVAVAPVVAEERLEAETTTPVHRPITVEEEVAGGTGVDSLHGHSGKSRFPALARLFGRWNTQGRFDPYLDDDLDLDNVPRERFLRPLAIVVATAAISFFIVVALLRLRDSAVAEPAPETPAMTAAAPPVPVPPPAPRVAAPAPAVRPAPVPAPARAITAPAPRPLALPAPRAIDLPPALAVKEATSAPPKRTAPRRRQRSIPFDPDAPIPLSF